MIWSHAIHIELNTILYLHCHRQSSSAAPSVLVLVCEDGAQHPPIVFPRVQHMAQFLGCVEAGVTAECTLQPHNWMDLLLMSNAESTPNDGRGDVVVLKKARRRREASQQRRHRQHSATAVASAHPNSPRISECLNDSEDIRLAALSPIDGNGDSLDVNCSFPLTPHNKRSKSNQR